VLPDAAYATALASIDGIGPRRLRFLLDGTPPPDAWASVVAGRADDQGHTWRNRARRIDVAAVWEAHRALGVGIWVLGDAGYPAALESDPEAPAVLFTLGDPEVIDLYRRVAVVGTRSATRQGVGVAAQLGADLATAGVVVLSGMAMGIDCAAHEGASAGWQAARDGAAPPVAVVVGGLDAP
jgi:DNA processing protein